MTSNLLLVLALLVTSPVFAGSTRVGNGDDGADLEGAEPLTDSQIIAARASAIAILNKVNTPGIPGLGMLVPELEKSPLYMSKLDSEARISADQGTYHSDMHGRVYARTFAELHAPTRFFPAAKSLSEQQLQALHIHEALHRALPASIRENESIVAEMTLAIVSPGTNHDRVKQTAERVIPISDRITLATSSAQLAPEETPIPESARVLAPSTFGYSYRSFLSGTDTSGATATSMHLIRSYFYPFGTDRSSFGLGIDGSLVNRPTGSEMGPLGLSARFALWSGRGFDVGMWGTLSLNALSPNEFKNSVVGRDVGAIGISMRKDLKFAYFENFIGYSFAGQAVEQIGNTSLTHEFGGVVNVASHVGANFFGLQAGGFVELHLADFYRQKSVSFEGDTGRYRILSGGPEITLMTKNFSVGVNGRFLLDSTKEANFDYLGNILGTGVAQGSIGATVSFYF
jgi:hypothetical protein